MPSMQLGLIGPNLIEAHLRLVDPCPCSEPVKDGDGNHDPNTPRGIKRLTLTVVEDVVTKCGNPRLITGFGDLDLLLAHLLLDFNLPNLRASLKGGLQSLGQS